MRFGLVCEDPNRTERFKQALSSCGLPKLAHRTYSQFIESPEAFQSFLGSIDILRLDSPGGSFESWAAMCRYSGFNPENFSNEFGKIYPLKPSNEGFDKAVRAISQAASCPKTFDPKAIALFMDKERSHSFCAKNNLPVPQKIPKVRSCQALETTMKEMGLRRAFMKLKYGSAASGVLAIEMQGRYLRVITTAEMKRSGEDITLYNSLKVRKYLDDEARQLIDTMLARYEVHIEEWIPKLRLSDHPIDIRLLVIGGQPAHLVIRSSSSPITNLHLGNERFQSDILRRTVSETFWNRIQTLGQQVGSYFPDQFCIGLDIGIDRASEHVFIIEINAFGDYLNDVMYEGMDPYTYQVKALEKIYAKR
ncbi:MAG: STM4014 family protein [Hellea sp.]